MCMANRPCILFHLQPQYILLWLETTIHRHGCRHTVSFCHSVQIVFWAGMHDTLFNRIWDLHMHRQWFRWRVSLWAAACTWALFVNITIDGSMRPTKMPIKFRWQQIHTNTDNCVSNSNKKLADPSNCIINYLSKCIPCVKSNQCTDSWKYIIFSKCFANGGGY